MIRSILATHLRKVGDSMPAYKDEARGTWYCRFRYTDYTGEKHETTKRGFKTKKAALQYEA